MTRGVFLAFEGIDVSGKSTQARRVAAAHDALFTFEPGDTPLGRELRHWVLDAATPMEPATEALIMLTDRSHHVRSVIEPALASGRSVVSDRFYASTLAYQGYGRGIDLGLLRAASELAIGSCRPMLTILLDVSLEVVNERRAHNAKDRFEAEDLSFHERVRRGYLELAKEDDWFVVDGARSENDVASEIEERVARLPW
ncbi:MAG: dTMP kinase [Acidimicrobiales bacterium]